MNVLAITTPAGLAMLALALLTMKKRPKWHKTTAIMMLCAGIGLAGILGIALTWIFGLLTKLFAALAHGIGSVPALPTILTAIPLGIQWVLGVVIFAWFVYDMWPKHGKPHRHTAWIGLFVAAAWVLMPPLSTLVGIR